MDPTVDRKISSGNFYKSVEKHVDVFVARVIKLSYLNFFPSFSLNIQSKTVFLIKMLSNLLSEYTRIFFWCLNCSKLINIIIIKLLS